MNARPGTPLRLLITGAADAALKASRAKRGCSASANLLAAAAQIVIYSELGQGYVHVAQTQSRRGTIFINRTCRNTVSVSAFDPVSARRSLTKTWTAKYTC